MFSRQYREIQAKRSLRWKIALAVILLALLPSPVGAQSPAFPFTLDGGFRYANIAPFVETYGDTSLTLGIDDIISQEEDLPFYVNRKRSLHRGITDAIWWVRFPLKNTTGDTLRLLVEIGNQDLNRLQLFTRRSDGRVDSSMLTGDAYPFAQRPVEYRYVLFPFQLAPGEEVVNYLMSDKHDELYVMPVELWELSYFQEADTKTSFVAGLQLGLFLLYLLVALLLLLFFQDRQSLYYFLFSAALILYLLTTLGFSYQYLWRTAFPNLNNTIRPFLTSLQLLFLLLFVIENLRQKARERLMKLPPPPLIQFYKSTTIRAKLTPKANVFLRILIGGKNLLLVLIPAGTLLSFYAMSVDGLAGVIAFILVLHIVLLLLLMLTAIYVCLREYFDYKDWESLLIAGIIGGHLAMIVLLYLHGFDYLNTGPDFHRYTTFSLIIELGGLLSVLFVRYHRSISKRQKNIEVADQRRLAFTRTLLTNRREERQRLAGQLNEQLLPLILRARHHLGPVAVTEGQVSDNSPQALMLAAEEELKAITYDLIPPEFSRLDLHDLIIKRCHQITASGKLSVSYQLSNSNSHLTSERAHDIYRLVQELLNNVLRHAGASRARVTLSEESEALFLTVEDYGKGISVDYTDSSGKLLSRAADRSARLGGELTVTTSAPGGTRILVRIPLYS